MSIIDLFFLTLYHASTHVRNRSIYFILLWRNDTHTLKVIRLVKIPSLMKHKIRLSKKIAMNFFYYLNEKIRWIKHYKSSLLYLYHDHNFLRKTYAFSRFYNKVFTWINETNLVVETLSPWTKNKKN